jgi:ABC-2 type transport system ATP-binding protein
MPHETAVETRELTRRFGKFTAVDSISLALEPGRVHGFLGPNGAGKSTLFRMLCGLLAPTSGAALVDGIDVERRPRDVKQNIGYMSQRFSLYVDLSVRQNLEFYAGIYRIPRAKRTERMDYVYRMADLRERRDQLAGSLSGGWKQRLALGCAVLHEPRILFLDEPTAGVDPISRRRFWDIIHDLKESGVTVLITTHYMDEAERCDTLSLIAAGRLVASAPPRELRDQAVEGAVLRVDADPVDRALAALSAAPGLRRAHVFGRSIHVEAGDEASGRAAVAEALRSANLSAALVEPTQASMEDVFIALVERAGRTDLDRFDGGAP